MTLFLRVIDADVDQKAQALKAAVHGDGAVFEVEPSAFAQVPGSPFAYWIGRAVRHAFGRHFPVESQARTVKQGLATADDFRFVRAYWELGETSFESGWFDFAKGGSFSRFYKDVFLAANWRNDGSEMKAWTVVTYGGGHWSRNLRNPDFYFRPGLTWPLRTNGLSIRAMPRGCVFSHKGPATFVESDSPKSLLALAAVINSMPFGYLVSVQLARTELAQSYEVGLIQRTPVPDLSSADTATLAQLARRGWSLKRTLDTVHETSHAFLLPSALRARLGAFDTAAIHAELARIQDEIDDHAFRLYGLEGQDRAEIERWASRSKTASTSADDAAADGSDEDAAEDAEDESAEEAVGTSSERDALLSYGLGVAFGRFDLRLATGERAMPPEPEPFDPLPTRSPGMWPEAEASAAPRALLVDDLGHRDDLSTAVQAVLDCLALPADAQLSPEALRAYFAQSFFPLHIKMYSKSRRKAPIYWQLATPSASYSVWLYLHAFSKDTLFRVQNDYAAPKLAHEERRLESLTSELRDGATATQRKELAAQENFVDELRAFLEEVKRIAPLWNPNLDDGVVINFAPLWRLVPQHKNWQKELKSTWDALCEGKYDWAHLALHLWPERVVPKCAQDRSLAIAHGLEDVFWVLGTNDKWTARKTPTRSVDELVRERTSPAVKAALTSLLGAPAASGTAKKTKKGKANA